MPIPNQLRDQLITDFRYHLCSELDLIPFPHQADWWVTADGYDLTEISIDPLDPRPKIKCRTPSNQIEHRLLKARPDGRAKVISLLGSYKAGKSWSAGVFAASFAAVPDAKVYLVGSVYDMCAPEFEYLAEMLLSDRGMKLKYKSFQNKPKIGAMNLELQNGAKIEARSWESRESLKGKEVDCYIFCEAYQLPGIECFTSVRQNLRARKGYAVFPTTPDRPWVAILHQNGHGKEKGWVCRCGVPSSSNPITYDEEVMKSDKKLMTREKFQIAHGGQLGNYIGSVFDYQIGTREITLSSHPDLWHNPSQDATKENFKLPHDWHIVIGADTGTFMAALYIGISPSGEAYILDEHTNFTYIGGVPEVLPGMSVQIWAEEFKRKAAIWRARNSAWADSNSQFKVELATHGIGLMPNKRGREVRTEAAREYFQHEKVFLAPWLKILPYELENAKYPEESTMTGRFERVKGDNNDHLVDCMEHIFSRHPRGRKGPSLHLQDAPIIPAYTGVPFRKRSSGEFFIDPHLGGF